MSNKNDHYQRSLEVTPGGAQTFSRMHGHMGPRSYPKFATKAEGPYIWTEDGARYIDLAGANASAPLGFNHPEIVRMVKRELGTGGTLSLPTLLELRASEAMVAAVPFGEMVRWVRTGSEAVSGAIRSARRVTGKQLVVTCRGSYHGWHPWTDDSRSSIVAEVDELASDGFGPRWHGRSLADVAAILIEPPRFTVVDDAYIRWLQGVRALCSEHNVALVYDDVVYGFRYRTGGLQEASGVAPDLACFSKALGNGVPVGCIVGRRDFLVDTPVSSTFGGETTGLAAALAVLQVHATRLICQQLWEVGKRVQSHITTALNGSGLEVVGTPIHFRFQVQDGGDELAVDRFLTLCAEEHVLIHRAANNVSLAMDDHGVCQTLEKSLTRAVKRLHGAI